VGYTLDFKLTVTNLGSRKTGVSPLPVVALTCSAVVTCEIIALRPP